MRLYDPDRAHLADVSPATEGRLTLCSCLPAEQPDLTISAARILLMTDVIRRVADVTGLQVVAVRASPGTEAGRLQQRAAALNIHPVDPEPVATARREYDVHVGGAPSCPMGHAARHWVTVEEVVAHHSAMRDLETGGRDPLGVRLALLGVHHRQPIEVTPSAMADADVVLAHWRARMAEWATRPSSAMPPDVVARMVSALDDDLDVPRLLEVLAEVEHSPSIRDGSKFEVFAFIDRILGLDLARTVGRPLAR